MELNWEVSAVTEQAPSRIWTRADYLRSQAPQHRLYERARAGELERIAPGAYAEPGAFDDTTATLSSIALRKPSATICLLSALALHDLTDEIPQATHIALPRGDRTLVTPRAPIRWHSFDRDTFDMGRGEHRLDSDITMGLYSAERSITDAFRLRHALGSDIANEALKRWLRRSDSAPAQLLAMARHFPKAYPALRSTLEILL